VWVFQLLNTSTLTFYFADVDTPSSNGTMLYDLIANVTLDSVAGTTRDKESTVWKVHLAAGAGSDDEKWFMIQDLIVEETRKEMIFLGETILQVWIPHIQEVA
jgi:U4/U6.U5 tri-snRNP-associated protein 2